MNAQCVSCDCCCASKPEMQHELWKQFWAVVLAGWTTCSQWWCHSSGSSCQCPLRLCLLVGWWVVGRLHGRCKMMSRSYCKCPDMYLVVLASWRRDDRTTCRFSSWWWWKIFWRVVQAGVSLSTNGSCSNSMAVGNATWNVEAVVYLVVNGSVENWT